MTTRLALLLVLASACAAASGARLERLPMTPPRILAAIAADATDR